jgi:hypothetical protein
MPQVHSTEQKTIVSYYKLSINLNLEIMTKSKRIEKKAAKVAKVEEVKKSPEEIRKDLLAKALGKKPSEVKLAPTENDLETKALYDKALKGAKDRPAPVHEEIKVSDAVIEEIVDDLDRGDDDELEIIEVPEIKGKKVISQNSAQAQKLLKQLNPAFVKETPVPAKKKLADMSEKERKEYYINLSAKATAAKVAKAEAKLAAEGKTDLLKKVPETAPKVGNKATRSSLVTNPLGEKIIPEGMTGSKFKTALKVDKKNNKPTKETTSKRTGTPLSKMTIAELEGIRGTISDVQWKKYFKMAGGVSGAEPKKVIEKKAETVAPVVKKATRTAVADPKPEIKEVNFAPKAEVKKVVKVTLADFTLDELISELKARGCKGSIHICTEVEL